MKILFNQFLYDCSYNQSAKNDIISDLQHWQIIAIINKHYVILFHPRVIKGYINLVSKHQ